MMEYGELDQFLLIKYLDKIVNWHKDYEKDNNPYENLILLQSSKPDITLNRILNCDNEMYNFFNGLTNIQKAAMMPKLELYYMTKDGYKIINFRNFPDFEEYRNFATNTNTEFNFNGEEKEDGVGLKRITINDRNQNPGTVNLDCKVELFFDNILALTNSAILQLIRTPEIRASRSERDFRLKLVAGWQTPVDFGQQIFSIKDLELIERSNTVYLLSLVKHDLAFNQNGSLSLTIYYQGALEKYLASSSEMDIFSNSSEAQIVKYLTDSALINNKDGVAMQNLQSYITAMQNKILYEAQIDALSKAKLTASEKNRMNLGQDSSPEKPSNNPNEAVEDKLRDLEEKLNETLKLLSDFELFVIKDKYSRFLRSLQNNQRLFFLPISKDIYSGLQKDLLTNNALFWAPVLSILEIKPENFSTTDNRDAIKELQRQTKIAQEQFIEKIRDAAGDEDKLKEITTELFSKNLGPSELSQNSAGAASKRRAGVDQEKFITYTTLGDIINIARSFVDIPPEDNVEILLGPCIMGNVSINIASFPIAISTFMIWFVNSVIRKAVRKYQFWEFIYDIIGALVTPTLNAVGLIPDKLVNINLSTTISISDKQLEKGKVYLDENIFHYLSKNIFNTKDVYSYMVLYMKDYEMDQRDGILVDDMKDGIYHFGIGRDRGIVKTIDFSKVDFPRLRDMRLTTEGFNNVGDLLREHYDMNIKTIGSPLFIVGGQVYFDGAYLGESGRNITELIGLGGYYLITGIETSFSKDLYESNIKCTWTAMRKTSAENYKIIEVGKQEEGQR